MLIFQKRSLLTQFQNQIMEVNFAQNHLTRIIRVEFGCYLRIRMLAVMAKTAQQKDCTKTFIVNSYLIPFTITVIK